MQRHTWLLGALAALILIGAPLGARADGSRTELPRAREVEERPASSYILLAQLTDEERERLEDLEKEIKREEQEAYEQGVKKGRTNAAIWGCVTGAAVFAVFYVVVIVAAVGAA